MATTHEVEIWVVVDADGDYEVGKTDEDARTYFEDNIGGSAPRRLVKVVLTVPAPEPVVMVGTVPAESSEGAELRVA